MPNVIGISKAKYIRMPILANQKKPIPSYVKVFEKKLSQ